MKKSDSQDIPVLCGKSEDIDETIYFVGHSSSGYGHWLIDTGYVTEDVPLNAPLAEAVVKLYPDMAKLAERMDIGLPTIFLAGAAGCREGDYVARYLAGSAGDPVLMLNAEFDWEERAPHGWRDQVAISLFHEMGHAYADSIDLHEGLCSDPRNEELIENFGMSYHDRPSRKAVQSLRRDLMALDRTLDDEWAKGVESLADTVLPPCIVPLSPASPCAFPSSSINLGSN